MIKFAVKKETFEYKESNYDNARDAYFGIDNHNDKIFKVCDTLDEAREVLSNIKVSSFRFSSPIGNMVQANVAYIEESDFELNDDGEWELISGGDYHDFKSAEEM